MIGLPAALAAAASGFAACGGNVIVDPAAGEGGGGAGTTAVAGSGGGPTTTGSAAVGVGGQGAGTSSSSSGGGPHDAACVAFCEEAGLIGCPLGGDCFGRCLGVFVNGCDAEGEAMLACTSSSLTETCQVDYLGEGDACYEEVSGFLFCQQGNFAFSCETGQSSGLQDGSCDGEFNCSIGQIETQCDGQGTCACFTNGEFVGTCQSLLNGAEFCLPNANCCAPLFEM